MWLLKDTNMCYLAMLLLKKYIILFDIMIKMITFAILKVGILQHKVCRNMILINY